MNSIQDPTGTNWSSDDVQLLVIQLGSLTDAAKRLGTKTGVLRTMGIKTPTEFFTHHHQDAITLLTKIAQHTSIEALAEHHGVSPATIKTHLATLGINPNPPAPDPAAIQVLMERWGSVRYTARALRTTEAAVKRAFPDWRSLTDPTKTGSTSTRTGHVGEKYFIDNRGEHITAAPSLKSSNHEGYDVMDDTYGRVNVKAIPPNQHGQWVFEIRPSSYVDNYALIQLSPSRVAIGWSVISYTDAHGHAGDTTHATFSTKKRSNGDVAVVLPANHHCNGEIHSVHHDAT